MTNGGVTYSPSGEQTNGLTYDVDGRVNSISYPYNVDETYGYDAGNRRVWRSTSTAATQVFFTDPGGQLLGVYDVVQNASYDVLLVRKPEQERAWFAGRLIGQGDPITGLTSGGTPAKVDRLGSVYQGSNNTYLPYGEERTVTTQDAAKFATYERGASGLDYAVNRHYSAAWGRFTSADPYQASAALTNPQSWNRYAYVQGDPVNFHDPKGLYLSVAELLQGEEKEFVAPFTSTFPWYWEAGYDPFGIESNSKKRTTVTFSEMKESAGLWTAVVREFLEATIETLTDSCIGALDSLAKTVQANASVTRPGLESFANQLYFYDVTLIEGGLPLRSIGMPADVRGSSGTVSGYAAAAEGNPNAISVGYSTRGGPLFFTKSIILTANWHSAETDSGLTLVHEEMHNLLGRDDGQIVDLLVNKLGYSKDGSMTDSQNFHAWMDTNCGKRR